jgi:hypothetical protein
MSTRLQMHGVQPAEKNKPMRKEGTFPLPLRQLQPQQPFFHWTDSNRRSQQPHISD